MWSINTVVPLPLQRLPLHGSKAKACRLLVEVGQESQGADNQGTGGDEELVLAPAGTGTKTYRNVSNILGTNTKGVGQKGEQALGPANGHRSRQRRVCCCKAVTDACATLMRRLLSLAV